MHGRRAVALVSADSQGWRDFIVGHPEAGVFHHPSWVSTISETYNYSSFVLAAIDEYGSIAAGIPFIEVKNQLTPPRWVSLPFSDHCRPLYRDKADLRLLVESLKGAHRDGAASAIQVRWPLLDSCVGLEVSGLAVDGRFIRHVVRLPPKGSVVDKGFSRTTRQNVRAARRHGLSVEIGISERDVRTYYSLHVETRRRHGIPPQPWRFFKVLYKNMLEGGLGFVLLVRSGSEYLAGLLCLAWGEAVVAKYSASRATGQILRPNELAVASALEWSVRNGYKAFDFGRTELSQEGLCRYKRGFGASEMGLDYVRLPAKKPNNNAYIRTLRSPAQHVLQTAPDWVLRLTGRLLYRYLA